MYAWPPWPLPLTPGRGQWCDTNVARASTTSAQSRVVTQLLACKPNRDVFTLGSPIQGCSHYRRLAQPRVSRRSGCFNLAWFPHSRSKTQPRDQLWPSFVRGHWRCRRLLGQALHALCKDAPLQPRREACVPSTAANVAAVQAAPQQHSGMVQASATVMEGDTAV